MAKNYTARKFFSTSAKNNGAALGWETIYPSGDIASKFYFIDWDNAEYEAKRLGKWLGGGSPE